MAASPIITLMTDFGDQDSYVGAMKGVILTINPDARIVDICHHAPSFRIEAASYLLWTYYALYPKGTVHCVVVDPDVGGARDALIIECDGYLFALPDNGLISMALDGRRDGYEVHKISNPALMMRTVSATFHGRDVFAPAAAHLSKGMPPAEFGPRVGSPRVSAAAPARRSGNSIAGTVVHVDKFGNYITSVPRRLIAGFMDSPLIVKIGNFTILGLSGTYSDKAAGEMVAYIGSSGLLEIGVVKGSAADIIGVKIGAEVIARGREADGNISPI